MAAPAQRVVVPMPAAMQAIIASADAALAKAEAEMHEASALSEDGRVNRRFDARAALREARQRVAHLREREENYARNPHEMPWQRVVMEIDAMPGVPAWKEIERQVDAALEAELDIAKSGSMLTDREYYNTRVSYDYLADRWAPHLRRLFPTVHAHVLQRRDAHAQLVSRGVALRFKLRFLPDYQHLPALYSAWLSAHRPPHDSQFETEPYAMALLTPAQATAMLERQLRKELDDDSDVVAGLENQWVASQRRLVDERFKADLRAVIERKTARTNLAQSGLIDRLALRDRDAAHALARYLAPDTVTLARPLVVREHALQLEQLRATMSAADRPEAVLARATRQLEHLLADVSQETSAKKQRRGNE